MRILKTVIIIILLVVLLLVILTLVTSGGVTQIIDLVNSDTERFYETYDFKDKTLSKYVVNDVIFIPYTNQNPEESYEQDFSTYALELAVYRPKGNTSSVLLNAVTIEGQKNASFTKITRKLKAGLEFKDYERNPGLQVSLAPLIEAINADDMKLNDRSQLKVVLNVSVTADEGKTTTRDLEYLFETRIRKYLIQR